MTTGTRPLAAPWRLARLLARLLAVFVLFATLSGCSSCSCRGDRAVPFKRGSQTAASADGGVETAVSKARPGSIYPAGTTDLQLNGQRLQLSTGSIRAALDVDLDADGTPDALLLTEDEAGAPSLQSVHRAATGWEAPLPVGALATPDEHCAFATAQLEALDASYAVARVELACGAPAAVPAGPGGPGAVPSPPDPPPPPGAPAAPVGASVPMPAAVPVTVPVPVVEPHARQMLWVVALDSPPRVLERMTLPAGGDGSAAKLVATLAAGDFDADGHSDLQLGLDVAAPELATTHLELRLWNRAGGLARDRAEPEQTLLALADQAKTERKRKPAAAALLARQVLTAYEALCHESGSALLGIDGGQGLECGPSLAAGRAGSVLAAVLVGEGKLLQALERYQALSSPALRLNDNDWERVRSALQSRVDHGFSWREGPSVALPPGSAARLSVVAFLDEQHVLLRGTSPRSYDLATATAEPIGVHGSTLIMDPGARFAVSSAVRACEGDRLAIVRVAQILEGVVAGPPVAEPLIAAAGSGVPCAPGSPVRDPHGGFRPLSWTAQGVLLTRGAELWLLALDDTAHASAPAQRVEPTAALPAATYSGEVSADGRLHALLTPLGIAVLERASGRVRLIALPDETGPVPSDLALSPSGKALAIVRSGKLFVAVATDGAAGAPPAPPATALPATPPTTPNAPPPPGTTSSPVAPPPASALHEPPPAP